MSLFAENVNLEEIMFRWNGLKFTAVEQVECVAFSKILGCVCLRISSDKPGARRYLSSPGIAAALVKNMVEHIVPYFMSDYVLQYCIVGCFIDDDFS